MAGAHISLLLDDHSWTTAQAAPSYIHHLNSGEAAPLADAVNRTRAPSGCGALLFALKLFTLTVLRDAVMGKEMLAADRSLSGASAGPVRAHTETAAFGFSTVGVQANTLLGDQS